MVNIRPFTKDDIGYVEYWLKLRKMPIELAKEVPEHGYIAYASFFHIGAGFLRRAEGNSGFLDSFITNPDAPSGMRDEAMEMLSTKLISDAKSFGLKQVIVMTVDKNVQARAERLGLKLSDYKMLALKV